MYSNGGPHAAKTMPRHVPERESSASPSSSSNQRTPSPTMELGLDVPVQTRKNDHAPATPRIFVGIINKKNKDEMVKLAHELFWRHNFHEYGTIHVHSHGFYVDLRPDAVEEALDKLDEARLEAAVRQSVTVRVVLPDEKDTAIIERLDKELWVRPKNDRVADLEISALVRFFQQHGLVPKNKGWGDDREIDEEFRSRFISRPAQKPRNQHLLPKYVVQMISSEAVMVAVDKDLVPPMFLDVFNISVSSAAEHKHRHDVHSVVVHLPNKWRMVFYEDQFDDWLKPAIRALRVGQCRQKVKTTRCRQIFGDSESHRSALIEIIANCGIYPNHIPVAVLKWESYILYDYITLLDAKYQRILRNMIEGSDELLQDLQQRHESKMEKKPLPTWKDDDGNAAYALDTFYGEISRAPKEEIPFYVYRPGNGKAEVHYYDIFITSKDYSQACLKKRVTVAKFQPQLRDLMQKTGAEDGWILNDYLSFDSLGGIVFYLYYADEDGAIECRDLVQRRRNGWALKDVIQQTEGKRIATSVVPGRGFDVVFRNGETVKEVRLRDFAQKYVTEDQTG